MALCAAAWVNVVRTCPCTEYSGSGAVNRPSAQHQQKITGNYPAYSLLYVEIYETDVFICKYELTNILLVCYYTGILIVCLEAGYNGKE